MRTKGNKTLARSRVRQALKSGKLKKLPCQVCGFNGRLQAHHPDYSKPLKVIWLCATHHYDLHQKENPPHKIWRSIVIEKNTAEKFKKAKKKYNNSLTFTNTQFIESLLSLT